METTFALIPELTENNVSNFWNKVSITANDEKCWDWRGAVRQESKQYGRVKLNDKLYSAHRVSYLINNGVDPKEMHVLHQCDNQRCVNPKHLFLGTNADNIADKVSKNRQARGNNRKRSYKGEYVFWKGGYCNATESDFMQMIPLYNEGKNINELVKIFKVCKKTIANWLRFNGIIVRRGCLLTQEIADCIRKEYVKNDYVNKIIGNTKDLTSKYKIGKKTIYDIVNGITWKNI